MHSARKFSRKLNSVSFCAGLVAQGSGFELGENYSKYAISDRIITGTRTAYG